MNIFTVSLFGHREISNPLEVENALVKEVELLIRSKEYVEFLIGRNGDFDLLAASAIRRTQKALDRGNSALVLVLPYMTDEYRQNTAALENYYDEVEICEEAAESHFKAAFSTRNRIMAERSDLILCCIEHQSGGAFQTVKFARTLNKPIVNLAEKTQSAVNRSKICP